VNGLAKMVRRLIGEDIEFGVVLAPELHLVKADRAQIEQILLNLAVNARDAMPRGGKLLVETRNVVLDQDAVRRHFGVEPGPHAMLVVSDTGCGMDEKTQARIFEPFFTTKEVGKGTGLGLAMVYATVRQSNGCIDVVSQPGQGTTFTIYLPRCGEEVLTHEAPPSEVEGLGGTETILLVEDDPSVRAFSTRGLEGHGYTVLAARDGQEALALAKRHAGLIDLLVTDVVMPAMSGPELTARWLALSPHTKVLDLAG